jgi:outer membrane protein
MAMGLVALGAAAIGGRSIGQDTAVRKASNEGAATQPRLPSAVIGVIDMDAVFKGYTKVAFLRQQIEAESTARRAELNKLQAEAQKIAKEMDQLTPGTPDFKTHDSKLTELGAKFNAEKEQAQRDLSMREAEALATIYKEIQAMVESVAKANKMNFVLQISNEPVSGADPRSAMAAMARSVVWSDGGSDITDMVTKLLNRQYDAAGGQKATAAAPGTNNAAPSAPQSPAQQPARTAGGTPSNRPR